MPRHATHAALSGTTQGARSWGQAARRPGYQGTAARARPGEGLAVAQPNRSTRSAHDDAGDGGCGGLGLGQRHLGGGQPALGFQAPPDRLLPEQGHGVGPGAWSAAWTAHGRGVFRLVVEVALELGLGLGARYLTLSWWSLPRGMIVHSPRRQLRHERARVRVRVSASCHSMPRASRVSAS